MISTSFISSTGFMKCIPITLSGHFVAAPSSVIEIDDVLGEDRARLHRLIQFAEDLQLEVDLLGGGLDHEVAVGEISQDPLRRQALSGDRAKFARIRIAAFS
jgi:hypothetical protein